jgi:hypothetical protein
MATKRKTGKKLDTGKRNSVMEKPAPPHRKAQRTRLTNAKLRQLAEKHKPPQSWYEEEEEGLY